MLGSPDNGVPVLRTRSARLRRVLMPLFILSVVGIVALLLAAASQQQGHDPDHAQNEQRHQNPAQARTAGTEHRDSVVGRAKHDRPPQNSLE